MVDPDAKYGLRGDATVTILSAYMDTLVCRSSIIAVGMPLGYSLPTWGRIKFRRKEGLGSP